MTDPSPVGEGLDVALAGAAASWEAALPSPEALAAYEAEAALEARRALMEHSGVEDVLDGAGRRAVVRDELADTSALRTVRGWVVGCSTGRDVPVLALFGDTGRGKTVAGAWGLARKRGRYITAADLIRMHHSRYGPDAAKYDRLLRVELLVVDELGLAPDPLEEDAALYRVVDRRQRLPRMTLLLGNLSRPDYEARYNARTRSRMASIGRLQKAGGDDLRRAER